MKNKILIFLLFITFSVIAQQENSTAPYFFIQISDTQFGMFENNKGFEKETELYEETVKHINRLKPDFVVITGDLINKPDSREQLAEFKRITSKIASDIPVYLTPGNHDVKNEPDRFSIKQYLKDYQYQWFSFEHKGSQYIGVNSSVIKTNFLKYERKQFNFVKRELKKSKDAIHKVVFCHYPFFNSKFDEEEGYSNIGLENRMKYLDLFANYGVDAVFAGHLHDNNEVSYKDMQFITTCAVGKPLGDAPSGFRVIKVYPDRIDSIYYGLEKVPEAITLGK
ncbi:metallophosphoesterase [Aestuariivivens sediminicola]|uniref:metallophosphoesterase n=1 Tax=Aestuariivivens sediminicola TaxID=2913560 RepID=UPI001F59DFA1|nr:metallophosphoesterase [Aestuariivivens sediminicola]